MAVWLYVMGAYHALIVVYVVTYFLLSFCPCRISTAKTLFELFGLLLLGFHVSWLIYGNILVYHEAYHCRFSSDKGAIKLWKLMFSLIVMGYVLFFAFCCILSCSCCLFFTLCGLLKGAKSELVKGKIPYASFFKA